MIETISLDALAERLDDAMRTAHAVPQLAEPISLDEAYEVQRLSIARRVARGERRSGVKMGFTSKAKMKQMGLDELVWGRLTDAMLVDDGQTIDLAHYVHPRVEPEIAFLLKTPLTGHVSMVQAAAALEAVAPAIEIIDSRYENFKFSLTDVVADNTSSAGYVIGPWCDPRSDISNLGMVLEINGKPVQIGSSAAILDHPLRSLVAAARIAAAAGEPLPAGSVIMAGGATAAEALAPGNYVRLAVQGLGETVLFTKGA
jgi:2-oxo-3-hexenedioate decarboxylase